MEQLKELGISEIIEMKNKNSGKSYNCVNAGFVNAIDKVGS